MLPQKAVTDLRRGLHQPGASPGQAVQIPRSPGAPVLQSGHQGRRQAGGPDPGARHGPRHRRRSIGVPAGRDCGADRLQIVVGRAQKRIEAPRHGGRHEGREPDAMTRGRRPIESLNPVRRRRRLQREPGLQGRERLRRARLDRLDPAGKRLEQLYRTPGSSWSRRSPRRRRWPAPPPRNVDRDGSRRSAPPRPVGARRGAWPGAAPAGRPASPRRCPRTEPASRPRSTGCRPRRAARRSGCPDPHRHRHPAGTAARFCRRTQRAPRFPQRPGNSPAAPERAACRRCTGRSDGPAAPDRLRARDGGSRSRRRPRRRAVRPPPRSPARLPARARGASRRRHRRKRASNKIGRRRRRSGSLEGDTRSRTAVVAGEYRGGTDRVGFEPTIPLPVYRFSRPAPSATRTPVLHGSTAFARREVY